MALSGNIKWGKQVQWSSGDEMYDQQQTYTSNVLVPASLPMTYQVVWYGTTTGGTTITDQYIPAEANDLVNTVFIIEATTEFSGTGGVVAYGGWQEIGRIKKSRDIPVTDIITGTVPQQQTFTIDISRIVQDQLSYSLCPAGKGSWQTVEWGGMNGGQSKQDTVVADISPYIVRRNGTYRNVRVHCVFEQLDANGAIITSTTTLTSAEYVSAINAVVGFDQNSYLNQTRVLQEFGVSNSSPKLAMTNCPNYTIGTTTDPSIKKSISSTDNAEFLQFYVKSTFPSAHPSEYYNLYEVYGQAFNKDGSTGLAFVLGSEWENKLGTTHVCSDISHDFNLFNATAFEQSQNTMTIQNVAPAYINAHAYAPQDANYPYTSAITPITGSTGSYRVNVRGHYYYNTGGTWESVVHSAVYWYKIDDVEKKGPYNQVRFHWLNRAGGIDSYTATGNVTEGLSVTKNLIGNALSDRRYHQSSVNSSGAAYGIGAYHDDSMRGLDTYRGGNEVGSMNAANNKSVYTQPMPYLEAKWLEELFTSPNVWVQTDSETIEGQAYQHDAPFVMTDRNGQLRPEVNGKRSIYTPVIITNTEVTSVSQEEGLTFYNIEYSESQEIQTQRN